MRNRNSVHNSTAAQQAATAAVADLLTTRIAEPAAKAKMAMNSRPRKPASSRGCRKRSTKFFVHPSHMAAKLLYIRVLTLPSPKRNQIL